MPEIALTGAIPRPALRSAFSACRKPLEMAFPELTHPRNPPPRNCAARSRPGEAPVCGRARALRQLFSSALCRSSGSSSWIEEHEPGLQAERMARIIITPATWRWCGRAYRQNPEFRAGVGDAVGRDRSEWARQGPPIPRPRGAAVAVRRPAHAAHRGRSICAASSRRAGPLHLAKSSPAKFQIAVETPRSRRCCSSPPGLCAR